MNRSNTNEFLLGMFVGSFGLALLGWALMMASLSINSWSILPFGWRYGIGAEVVPAVLAVIIAVVVLVRWWRSQRRRAYGMLAGMGVLVALPALVFALLYFGNVPFMPR